jgi:seryl-tRNA synthetase
MNTNIIIPQKITTITQLEEVQALRAELKKQLKAVTDEKDKVARPLLDAISAERARFAPTITKYEEAIKKISDILSQYQTEQLKIQKQKEEKILSDGRLKTETVITRLAEVEQKDTKGFRKHQILKVTDITKIPQKYFHLDESQLLADLKAGETVPGAEIDVKMIAVG